MDDLLDALASQHAELAALVGGCSNDDWQRPTPCSGWDVADVLLHLTLTDEIATASARGELPPLSDGLMGSRQGMSVDDAAAEQVAAEREMGGEAIPRRWHDASRDMQAAFHAADPRRRVTWVTNQLSVETLAATRLSECWIHTGDIATALDLTGPSGDQWRFDPDAPPLTTIRGSAVEFCDVAARRVEASATDLVGNGPDSEAVLRVVRTYAL